MAKVLNGKGEDGTAGNGSSAYPYFAELLPRLHAMTVTVILSRSASVAVSAGSSNVLHVNHGDAHITIPLPDVPQELQTTCDTKQDGMLSLRLPVSSKVAKTNTSDPIPWQSSSLKSAQITCSGCSSTLLTNTEDLQWKDLPSEFWAEMMDCWVCHRGGSDHEHDGQPVNPSGEMFWAKPGAGFVGSTYFLISPKDLQNTKPSPSIQSSAQDQNTHPILPPALSSSLSAFEQDSMSECEAQCKDSDCCDGFIFHLDDTREIVRGQDEGTAVACRECEKVLGAMTPGGVRVPKWNVAVNGAKHPASKFVAAELLESVDAHATYHFLLRSEDGTGTGPEALRIWIFNPSLHITLGVAHPNTPLTNEAAVTAPTRVMKVLYRLVDGENTDTAPEENVESLTYANDVLHVIREGLKASTDRLPQGLRKFGRWDVGYLERFDDQR
ncbi:hypothetical protein SAICODRAFT_25207 [Saitoella complicata NRRL Y-17804]|uniref:uncharacterized protein n=1 Tax=Saitoella complicata (strain BCRC 22490 / CBS 7301 / JCM 7358 / NBRC 10748 / NRRL Y-17804) TaxID=698492 RepID=UPI00086714C5|nr:uncharacterized protein SAICODRAFT_25207 [Saitoella complicata NRRL Y-17804]ODQ53105.1 hypothetical protein SAICODRAFT_25207 [Saitoella complicata NRRL Y-17804]